MDIPKEFLSEEFLSQFKTGEDVTAFMKELHTRVYEQMLYSACFILFMVHF